MSSTTRDEEQEIKMGEMLPRDSGPPYPDGKELTFILLCLIIGTFLVALDTTIISIAVPTISTQFRALGDVGWYGSAYLMTLTAFQPTTSKVYKLFAPKTAYMVSIAVFEVGTILCAAAPASSTFILGRAVAGLGAAGLLQGALGIITCIAPLEKRQLYIGTVVSVFGISACIGPILGGLLCSRTTWRWCFWINLPLGAAIMTLMATTFKWRIQDIHSQGLNENLRSKISQMDPLGVLLLLGSVSSLFLALQQGGNTWAWSSSKIVSLFVCFGVLLILFAFVQWRLGEKATVPLRLLKDRTVLTGSLFLATSNASSYLKLYYIPFYFQAVHSSSVVRSGVDFLALALPQMVTSLVSSGLVTYTGYYAPFILLGQIICAIGTGFLTTLGLSTSTVQWAVFMVLAGWGTGMAENTPYIAIQASMKSEEDVFAGNGFATFIALLGGALAISIGSSVLDNSLTHFTRLLTPSISASGVLHAGALDLESLTTSSTDLAALKTVYAKAVDRVMILSLAITCVGTLVVCGMRWLNLKVVVTTREKEITSIAGVR